jgi:hypothetical protein
VCPSAEVTLPDAAAPRRDYPANSIERLIEGQVYDAERGAWSSVEGSWAAIRSSVEHRGNVDQEGWQEVLDLERSIANLGRHHPQAAALVILTLFGWQGEEVERVLSLGSTPYETVLAKAKNYLQADLNGEDPDNAYKSTRRPDGQYRLPGRVRSWHAPQSNGNGNGSNGKASSLAPAKS